MKKILGLVAALALVSSASTALAVDNAWFTLEGGGVPDGQGSGQTLVITRNAGDVTNLVIGFHITDTEGLGMAGYAYDVHGAGENSWNFSNAQNVGAGYTNFIPGAVGASLQFGATSFTGGATGLVSTFLLSITGSDLGVTNVFGQHGPTESAYLNGTLWFGSVGPNAPDFGSSASYGTWGDLPVITINTIPEPASLGLLAIGALALIRRRK
jgi:hypothetical protein